MKNQIRLRIALLAVQALAIGIIVAGTTLSGGPGSRTAEGRAAMMALSSGLLVPWIAGLALTGVLAGRLNRRAGGWVLGSILLPFVLPIVLAFMKEAPRPTAKSAAMYGANGADHASSAFATGADDSPVGFNEQGFCARCAMETSDESPGNINSVNGIGTALMGTRWLVRGFDPCPVCGSVIQSKWFTLGFGVTRLGTYRILYTRKGLTSSRFYGRRLLSDYGATAVAPARG